MNDLKPQQDQFWNYFESLLLDSQLISLAGRAKPQHYYDVLFGDAGVMISNTIDTRECVLRSRFFIRDTKTENSRGSLVLRQLTGKNGAINKLFKPQQLIWSPRPDDNVQTVGAHLPISFENTLLWPTYLGWLLFMNSKFRTVYQQYLSK